VVRQAGLRRYVQNHAVASADREREPDFDGVAEAWFDDVDAMRALAASAEYAAVRADEANFIDPATMRAVVTDEIVVVDGGTRSTDVKLIAGLRKLPELSPEQFRKHWRDVHGPLAAAIPDNRRYVQCAARLGIYRAGTRPGVRRRADVVVRRRGRDGCSGRQPRLRAHPRRTSRTSSPPGGFRS